MQVGLNLAYGLPQPTSLTIRNSAEKAFEKHPLKEKILRILNNALPKEENQKINSITIKGYEYSLYDDFKNETLGDIEEPLMQFLKQFPIESKILYLK